MSSIVRSDFGAFGAAEKSPIRNEYSGVFTLPQEKHVILSYRSSLYNRIGQDMTLNRGSSRADSLAESWRRTLAGVPTLPGRLEYLASLRNAHSGQYEHFGLS